MFIGASNQVTKTCETRERASTIQQLTSNSLEPTTKTRLQTKQRHTDLSGSIRFPKIQERTKTLILRLIILVIYITSGAAIFHLLEALNQDEEDFCHTDGVSNVETAMAKRFNVSMKEIRKLVHDLCQQFEKSHKCKYSHNDWSYYQSLYFVGSVTTTIGYGHLAPKTQYGRLFLIFYAFFGIPINLLALQSVGEHINLGFHNLITFTERKFYKSSRVRHEHIKTFVLSVILMILMLPIGGLMYYFSEKDKGWTYLDSVYYSFVAMSTIGFGDLVPNEGKEPRSTYERVMWFIRLLFLVVGLSLVSSVFTSVSSATKQIKAAYMSKKGLYMMNSGDETENIENRSFKQVACLRFKDLFCSVNVERTPSRQNPTTSELYTRFEDSISTTSISPSQVNGDVNSNDVIHPDHVDQRYRSISMALSNASLGCEYTLDHATSLAMVDRQGNTSDIRIETKDLNHESEHSDANRNAKTSTNHTEMSSNEQGDLYAKEMTPSIMSSEDDVRPMDESDDEESDGISQDMDGVTMTSLKAPNNHVNEMIEP